MAHNKRKFFLYYFINVWKLFPYILHTMHFWKRRRFDFISNENQSLSIFLLVLVAGRSDGRPNNSDQCERDLTAVNFLRSMNGKAGDLWRLLYRSNNFTNNQKNIVKHFRYSLSMLVFHCVGVSTMVKQWIYVSISTHRLPFQFHICRCYFGTPFRPSAKPISMLYNVHSNTHENKITYNKTIFRCQFYQAQWN